MRRRAQYVLAAKHRRSVEAVIHSSPSVGVGKRSVMNQHQASGMCCRRSDPDTAHMGWSAIIASESCSGAVSHIIRSWQ